MLTQQQLEEVLKSLTLDEMIGQMLCFYFAHDLEKTEEIIKKTHAGSVFTAGRSPEDIKGVTELMNKYSPVPGMVAADVEAGPGHVMPGEIRFPQEMAWAACGDEQLVEEAHEAIAARCRELGIHWSFSPIVDINYNMQNSVVNIRTASDRPEIVAKFGTAAVRGYQKNGMMAAGCKHFPGDGVDDRDQHFCTTVNSFSKKKWMETYGYVYKKMFKAGTYSVMVAHIALPAYDEKINDWVGYPPATVSHNLMTKLLKEELGFEGCIVSDAMSMIGASACFPQDRLAVEFVKGGGDIILFPLPEYFDQIKAAVLSGEISIERIKDAVRRVLKMKNFVRLFEDQNEVLKEIDHEKTMETLIRTSREIAEGSISLERNYGGVLPLDLKKGDKILLITLKKNKEKEREFYACDLDTIEEELKKRGFEVVSLIHPSRQEMLDEMKDAAAVLVNCKICSQDYVGGTLRINWEHTPIFWRGAILDHPQMVLSSFGDPYKLYDFPYVKTYVNAFSYSEVTQRAFVRAILGEIPFNGKCPVDIQSCMREHVFEDDERNF